MSVRVYQIQYVASKDIFILNPNASTKSWTTGEFCKLIFLYSLIAVQINIILKLMQLVTRWWLFYTEM